MKKIISGSISLILGLCVLFWARAHSPHIGFIEMITKYNVFKLDEPYYTIVLIVASIVILAGAVLIILGIREKRKKGDNIQQDAD